MKKLYGLLMVIMLLTVACSNPTKDDDKDEEKSPVTLKIWTPVDEEVYERWVESFQKDNPHVTINIQEEPWENYWTKLLLALESGTGPELFYQNTQYLQKTLKYSKSYDKEVISKNEFNAQYDTIEMHTINDEFYYIPLVYYTGALIYNLDRWEKAGFTKKDVPKTWEDLKAIKGQIQGFSYNGMEAELGHVLNYQQGMPIVNAKGQPNISNDIMENSLTIMTELNGNISNKHGWEQLADGEVTMIYAYGWDYARLMKEYPDLNLGISQTPLTQADSAVVDVKDLEISFGVNKMVEDTKMKVVNEFIQYITNNEDLLIEYCLYKGGYPAKGGITNANKIKSDPLLSIQGSYINKTIYPGPIPSRLKQIYDQIYTEVLYNEVPFKVAMDKAQKQANEVISESDFKAVEDQYKFYDELKFK